MEENVMSLNLHCDLTECQHPTLPSCTTSACLMKLKWFKNIEIKTVFTYMCKNHFNRLPVGLCLST